ncbi:MAG: hypothetical protein KC619_32685 [Myxococcales bacterium]|nr:hypothetical protein [Myxococcales bacterium]
MSNPRSLRWTSPEEVCCALVPWLDLDPRTASRTARLLSRFATPSLAMELAPIAADPARPYWVRVDCVRAIDRAGVSPPGLLTGLLAEPESDPFLLERGEPTTAPAMCQRLALAKTGDELSLVREWLEDAPPESLVRWAHEATYWTEWSPRIRTLVWDRFAAELAEATPTAATLHVAVWVLSNAQPGELGAGARDTLIAVLDRHWDSLTPDAWRDAMRASSELTARILEDSDRAAACAARRCFPTPVLADLLGPAELRARFVQVLVRTSARARCPLLEGPDPFDPEVRAAIDGLPTIEGGRRAMVRLLVEARLADPVRRQLARRIHELEPAAACTYLYADHPEELADVLHRDDALTPAHRRVLRSALHTDDAVGRYRALDLLERADEDASDWWAVLADLAGSSDRILAARAAGALALRGEPDAIARLVRGTDDVDVRVRGESFRWLGRIDEADRHLGRFERAMLYDHETDRGDFQPAMEQAAIALVCAVGRDARSSLLQSYFGPQGNLGLDLVEGLLEWLEANDVGEASPRERGERIERELNEAAPRWIPYAARRG